MTDFHVGQIFDNPYPPEAAYWCNRNGCYLGDTIVGGIEKTIICETPDLTSTERKAIFLGDFFKVSLGQLGTGYYRKKPKGYASAIESIITAERMCAKNNGLPAGILIFYKQPDFSKPEECCEEWLEANQIILPALTVEQFDELFINFTTAWNAQEHE